MPDGIENKIAYLNGAKIGDIYGDNYIEIGNDGTMTFYGTAHIADSGEGTNVFDSIILNGRMSTVSAAGGTVDIDASSDQYGEGLELRYNIADWADTYTLTAGTGAYIRMETNEANASGSIYGMQLYGVANDVNLQYLWGGLAYAYVKGTSAKTLTGVYAFQPEISFDAGSSTNTITDAAIVRAKLTGGVMSDYTVLDGYRLTLGDMDGQSRTYGNGILLEDDSSTAGTNSLTTGIKINIGCAKGIDFVGVSGGAASASGLLMGTGTSGSPSTTSTANAKFVEFRCQTTATSGDNRLVYLRYDIGGAGASGECLRAFTDLTAAAGSARGSHMSLQVDDTGYISGLGAGVDAQLFVGDAVVPAGGTYTALNIEIYTAGASSDISGVTQLSFMRFSNGGSAATNIDAKAFFFTLEGLTSGASNMWYDNQGGAPANVEEWLKVKTPAGVRYLALYDATT